MNTQIPAVVGGALPEMPKGQDSFRARTFWTENNGPIVEFKPEWHNSTGYLNNLVTDMSIWVGVEDGLCRTVDEHGRRVLIAKTAFGNVVVFERKVQKLDADPVVWVSNTPLEISRSGLLPSGAVSDQSFHIFFKEYESGRTGWQTLIRELINA